MTEFKERLRMAMERQGISQAELCGLADIPKSAMSQYVSGRFRPKQDRIKRLADVLEVDPGWLMGYDVDIESNAEQRVLRAYRQNAEFRQRVDRLLSECEERTVEVFRAAMSENGSIPPTKERMSSEQLAKIMTAPGTDEDL